MTKMFRKLKSQFRDERGMNLVELMISVFIISLSSAAMMMVSANQAAVTQFTRKQESRNTVASFIRGVTSTPAFIYYSAQTAINGNGVTVNQQLADCVLGQSGSATACPANVEFPIALYVPDTTLGRVSGPGGSTPDPVMYTDHIARPCSAGEMQIGATACPLAVTTTAIARCPLNAASCKQAQLVEVRFQIENKLQNTGSGANQAARGGAVAVASTLAKVKGSFQTDTAFVAQYKSQSQYDSDNNNGCSEGEVALGVDGLGNLICQKIDNLCPPGTYTVGLDRYMRPINNLNTLRGQYSPGMTVQCQPLNCGTDPSTGKPFNMISMFNNGSIAPECLGQSKSCDPNDSRVLYDVDGGGNPVCAWIDTCDEPNRTGLEFDVNNTKSTASTNRRNFTRAFQFYNGGVGASAQGPAGGVKSVCESYGCGLGSYMTRILADGQCHSVTGTGGTATVTGGDWARICYRETDGTYQYRYPGVQDPNGCAVPQFPATSYTGCVRTTTSGAPSAYILNNDHVTWFDNATGVCQTGPTEPSSCNAGVFAAANPLQPFPGGATQFSNVVNDFVTAAYCGYLDRTPDPGGFVFWENQLKSGVSAAEVTYCGFYKSPEFQTRAGSPTCLYPCLSQPGSEGNLVEHFYAGALGRVSDPGGKSFWINRISSAVASGYTRDAANSQVAKEFAISPEFIGRAQAFGLKPTGFNYSYSCSAEYCDYSNNDSNVDVLLDLKVPGDPNGDPEPYPVGAWVGADLGMPGGLADQWCNNLIPGTIHDEQASTRTLNDGATRINFQTLYVCNMASLEGLGVAGKRPFCTSGITGSLYSGYVYDKIRCKRPVPTGQPLACPKPPPPTVRPVMRPPPPPGGPPPPPVAPVGGTGKWHRWCVSDGSSAYYFDAGDADPNALGCLLYGGSFRTAGQFIDGMPSFLCQVRTDGTQPSDCNTGMFPRRCGAANVGDVTGSVVIRSSEAGDVMGDTCCCPSGGSSSICCPAPPSGPGGG